MNGNEILDRVRKGLDKIIDDLQQIKKPDNQLLKVLNVRSRLDLMVASMMLIVPVMREFMENDKFAIYFEPDESLTDLEAPSIDDFDPNQISKVTTW